MPSYGQAFQPGQDLASGGQQNGQANQGRRGGVQEAIQLLSLRIPNLRPGVGVLPTELLQSPGSGAIGGGPESLALLQRVLGNSPSGQSAGTASGGGGGFGSPAPLSNTMGSPDLLSQLMSAVPSTPSQNRPSSQPQFVGNIDTRPMQNAPFDPFGNFGSKFKGGYDPNTVARTEAANLTGGSLIRRPSGGLPTNWKVENDPLPGSAGDLFNA